MLHRFKEKINTIAPAFVVGIFACSASSAAAEEVKLQHAVYLGGIFLGGVETNLVQQADKYYSSSKATSNGAINWLFTWKAAGVSSGILDKGAFVPREYSYQSAWNKKNKGGVIKYQPDGSVTSELFGKKNTNTKKYTPIDPKDLKDSMDPISMAFNAAMKLAKGEGCKGQYPVYDGRRRFDVTLADEGQKKFKPSRYSVHTGLSTGCSIKITKLGGFRRNPSYDPVEQEKLVIWNAAPRDGGLVVPVRMQVNTDYGLMELHLEKYTDSQVKLASKEAQ